MRSAANLSARLRPRMSKASGGLVSARCSGVLASLYAHLIVAARDSQIVTQPRGQALVRRHLGDNSIYVRAQLRERETAL
jgi:hypothetical protein